VGKGIATSGYIWLIVHHSRISEDTLPQWKGSHYVEHCTSSGMIGVPEVAYYVGRGHTRHFITLNGRALLSAKTRS
jgi:hypothetical protein